MKSPSYSWPMSIVAAASLLTSFAEGDQKTIPEIKQLRSQWESSLAKGAQQVRGRYSDDLVKLGNRLRKNSRNKALSYVLEEQEAIKNSSNDPARIPQWEERSQFPSLRFARTIYRRKMTEMIELKNRSHERSLTRLKERFIAAGRHDDAMKVDLELAALKDFKHMATNKPLPLPESAADLQNYLVNSKWEIARTDDADEKKEKILVEFRADGTASFDPVWASNVRWETGSNSRSISISHISKQWYIEITFSEDMTTLTAHARGRPNVQWAGKRSDL